MSYGKFTIITGYKANAPVRPAGGSFAPEVEAWRSKNFKVYQLRGYWDVAKAAAYAEKLGLKVDEIEHKALDYSGKGRGGVDRRWVNIGGVMQAVTC